MENITDRDYIELCAMIIHDTLRIKSNCYKKGKLLKCEYIVCIGDDATSAIYAARIAKEHQDLYGSMPLVLCVGGKGLMSRWTHKTSEGKHLADVCKRLGIPDENLAVLDHGTNTGANVLEVAEYISRRNMGISVIFVATKRLSLRLSLTVSKQAPILTAYYYVIEEELGEACKWYNGKRLGNNQMMYHELASILDRCEEYAGAFQDPIPFTVPWKTHLAAYILSQKYRLKLPHKNLRSAWQFIYLWFEILRHRKKMVADLDEAIKIELKQQAIKRSVRATNERMIIHHKNK